MFLQTPPVFSETFQKMAQKKGGEVLEQNGIKYSPTEGYHEN